MTNQKAGPPRAAKWFLYFPRGPHMSVLIPDHESIFLRTSIKFSAKFSALGQPLVPSHLAYDYISIATRYGSRRTSA